MSVVPPVLPAAPDAGTVEAYTELLPLYLATPDDQEVAMNADLMSVGVRMLGHASKIESLVPQAEATFRNLDTLPMRQVALYAMGLLQAHALHKTATLPAMDPLPGLVERATAKRTMMLDTAQYLARQGLLDPVQVASVKGLTGYRHVAGDLMGLGNIYRQAWPTLVGKTTLTEADIDEATELADAIVVALGAREIHERAVSEAATIRQKAFAFTVRRYDAIRRIVSFLRWEEGDADDFAPSLFAGRGGRRKEAGEDDAAPSPDDATQDAPVAGKPAPGGAHPVTPVVPGQPGGSPFLDARPVIPGQPGGSPFLR